MFSEIEKKSRTHQVVEEIRNAVTSGAIEVGDRLPTERELSLQFGVSRTSIREAVRILSTFGLVQTTQGRGTFVTDRFSANIFSFLGFGPHLDRENFRLFFQARRVLETGCIPFVLEHVSDTDIRQLERLTAALEQETDTETLGSLDARFHEAIVELSRNPIIHSLYRMIYTMLKQGTSRVIAFPQAKMMAIRDHKRIIRAISSGNKNSSVRAIEKHLDAAAGLFELHLDDWEPQTHQEKDKRGVEISGSPGENSR